MKLTTREIDWEADYEFLLQGEMDYLVNVDPKFDEDTARRVGMERLKKLLERTSLYGDVLVDDDGKRVGYVVYRKRTVAAGEIVVSLLAVWVPPDERNRGHALLLLDHMFDHARKLGAHHVTTFVHPDNIASLNLYSKVGFVQTNIEMAKPL